VQRAWHSTLAFGVVTRRRRVARARQERAAEGWATRCSEGQIHGDAASRCKGVIMETRQASRARLFIPDGTLVHIIINQPRRFPTATPRDARSAVRASMSPKMIEAPSLHGHALDPEAVCFVTRLRATSDENPQGVESIGVLPAPMVTRSGERRPRQRYVSNHSPRNRIVRQMYCIPTKGREGVLSAAEARAMMEQIDQRLEGRANIRSRRLGFDRQRYTVEWSGGGMQIGVRIGRGEDRRRHGTTAGGKGHYDLSHGLGLHNVCSHNQ